MKTVSVFFSALLLVGLVTGCGNEVEVTRSAPPRPSQNLPTPRIWGTLLPLHAEQPDNAESLAVHGCIVQGKCDLAHVKPLGLVTSSPTIDDVMRRVLFSHPWMGTRFREFLSSSPSDVLLLARSVVAIVIAADVCPSFYTARTASIYLNPKELCQTEEECASVKEGADYRSEFGPEFSFEVSERIAGATQEFKRKMRMLPTLYHELVHAADFLSEESRKKLAEENGGELRNVLSKNGRWISQDMPPLTSTAMFHFSKRRFANATVPEFASRAPQPTEGEKFAAEFAADYAVSSYSFLTPQEDFAMSLEFLFFKFHFGLEVKMGFVSKESGLVIWGEVNRIAHPRISERALRMLSLVLPEQNLEEVRSKLGVVTPLEPGQPWNPPTSVFLAAAPRSSASFDVEHP